jgi:flavodoxin/ferredoxin
MKTKIFYFSVTGNSLYVARTIAERLGESEIVSIPKVINGQIVADSENIGIIFPVYAWGLPRIVAEFAGKIKLDKSRYVFAIATCGAMPGGTLGQLRKILRKNGSDLNAGFLLREDFRPGGEDEMPIIKFLRKITGIKPVQLKGRLSEIIDIIKNKKNHKPEMSSWAARILGNLFYSIAAKRVKTFDLNYCLDEKCDLCGICTRVCPRENIRIENGRISWNQNCEMCYGCYHWCPREAIHLINDTGIKAGYHNSEIALADVILR